MRLAWITDPHFDHCPANAVSRLAEGCATDSDACVITGDIGTAQNVVTNLTWFQLHYGKPVYFVLGNHDFYGGSFASVAASVGIFGKCWLQSGSIFQLARDVQLCGVDGWYDAQFGAPETSQVRLNDWWLIDELSRARQHGLLIHALRELGQQSASAARKVLARTDAKRVIFATHVPPFAESSVYDGKQSDDEWLPWFSNKALGFVLTEWAAANPDREMTVLCGHMHGRAVFSPLPNLTVKTGFADYGKPCMEEVLHV